jgi:dGTPase
VNGGSRRYPERSLECQIMNWADDVAYSLHDLADGYLAGFVTQREVENWAKDRELGNAQSEHLETILKKLDQREDFDRFLAMETGRFIEGVRLIQREHLLAEKSLRYRYGIEIDPAIKNENELFKRLAVDIIFRSPQLEQLEFKGRYIIKRLFETFLHGGKNDFTVNEHIFPSGLREKIKYIDHENYVAVARLICDYFAEQTDISLPRIYKRLFDPDYGSFYDIV